MVTDASAPNTLMPSLMVSVTSCTPSPTGILVTFVSIPVCKTDLWRRCSIRELSATAPNRQNPIAKVTT